MVEIIDRYGHGFIPMPLIHALRRRRMLNIFSKQLLKKIGELIRFPTQTVYNHVCTGAIKAILDFLVEKVDGRSNEGECQ